MRSGVLRTVLASSFVLALTGVPASANAQANSLADLGVGIGYAVNDNGQVAIAQGIYSNGTVTPLPALPGQTTPASPAAINATGQTAGSALTQVINGGYMSNGTVPGNVPVAYINGTLTNIALLFPEYTDGALYVEPGIATGINSTGQVVGYYTSLNPRSIDPPETVAFLYADGTSTQLPFSPPGKEAEYPQSNMAFGINDSGQITGTYATPDPNSPAANKFDAYIYNFGASAWTDLGQGTGYAINNAGQVTGALDVVTIGDDTDTIVGTYAFLYTNGTTINLGTLQGGKFSIGFALNLNNQVVGSSDLTGSSTTHAILYNGGINDLNTLISVTDPLKPYVTLTSAVGINDSMLIVANGVDSRTNLVHAYLFQAPQVQISPGPLNFGSQAVGGTSPSQTVC
jgi:probable HAF family extracellular repeat protein